MVRCIRLTCVCCLLITFARAAQPPGGGRRGEGGLGGPGGPAGPNPARMVEHALRFDADGDGMLSRAELMRFAEDFSRGPAGRGPGGNAGMPERPETLPTPPIEPPVGPLGVSESPGTVVDVSQDDVFRYLESNGLPDHITGDFPNRGNPNRISAQAYSFRMRRQPREAAEPIDAGGMLFGVALNGIPFDPGTAELWRNNRDWRYDALSGKINLGLDESNAHVQPTGAYHYHGLPVRWIRNQHNGDEPAMVMLGYAADGYPVYNQYGHTEAMNSESPLKALTSSWQLRQGTRPGGTAGPGGKYDGTFNQDWEYVAGSGDLDECNGREGVTAEYPDGTYYYVITEQFPFISRMFHGIPDESFQHGPPRGDRQRGGPPRDPEAAPVGPAGPPRLNRAGPGAAGGPAGGGGGQQQLPERRGPGGV